LPNRRKDSSGDLARFLCVMPNVVQPPADATAVCRGRCFSLGFDARQQPIFGGGGTSG
jgi:hypothetical protein